MSAKNYIKKLFKKFLKMRFLLRIEGRIIEVRNGERKISLSYTDGYMFLRVLANLI